METIKVGRTSLQAEIRRCMACKQTAQTCKITRFLDEAKRSQGVSSLGQVAQKSGLSEGIRYGNVTAVGIESHQVYSCDGLASDLELAGLNIITSIERRP